jgi:hypothetical protein
LRGGGADRMSCGDLVPGFGGEPHDVAFVDSTDRVDPNCEGMRVLLRLPRRR